MAEIDDTNLANFEDKNKENFVRHFVIPNGLKIIQNKIQIKSDGLIPPFNAIKNGCDDSVDKSPSMKITTKYHEEKTAADLILYVGGVHEKMNGFDAYASFCVQGDYLIYILLTIHH